MYESWWDFQSLPKLNSRDESWREFLCGENGIVRHWLRLGADGWRLDVVDEYPDELVRMIRQAARAEKPDALIIGEVWEDASCKEAYGEHRQYLMGHELGSVVLGIFEEEKLRELLELPEGMGVACLMPLGYPAEEPGAPKRKEVAELLTIK